MPKTALHPTLAAGRSDDQLVALVRAGHTPAFEVVVVRYGAALTAFARQVLGGAHHDAEEVVQDAFVRALAALGRPDRRPIVLKPWLYAITRNACLDRLRRPQRTTDLGALEGVLSDAGADPYDAATRREALQGVVVQLRRLPERQRSALVMHELEGRSHEETGAALGVSVGASKALVCRARATMAEGRAAA